ncbi:MAG: 16S rRNA (guanine(966)-N(2))-methyltransferase RsmD [Acidiferrobacterales bacterium]|nr:16S rRNA (guanine(966)-N(2))-methyltransferase RsmD [Acidiferrobacterales bacterium]
MSKRTKLNTIRIIGGEWRSRKLPVLNSVGLRPTTDRVRETLFNWLMHDLHDAHCLDLFAGTGALGIECLSRHAKSVDFVDSNSKAAEILQSNLRTLKVKADSGRVIVANALNFLSNAPSKPYDIVFLDPPFASDLLEQTANLLVQGRWLSQHAKVYLEQDKNKSEVNVPESWRLHRKGKAGQSVYYLYHS